MNNCEKYFRDGRIGKQDYLEKMQNTRLSREQLEEFWDKFDKDKDGYLNKEEFVQMLVKLQAIHECEQAVMILWAMFDENQDGTLSAEEFENMVTEMELDSEEREEFVSI